jgi:homocysteine S-methyltransferase
MITAVRLADEARTQFLKEHHSSGGQTKEIKVALSLGSFGATLPGAEEYGGMYPPPYGPGPDPQLKAAHEAINTFSDNQTEDEEASIKALEEFHLERLKIYSPVWDIIDCVSFETVPLRREIKAVRRVMASLGESMGPKLWWIGTVWPHGLFPEKIRPNEYTPAWAVADALMGTRDGEALPWGVGVNCTLVEHIPEIIKALESYAEAQSLGVWLVVYPNGGYIYHPQTQSWIPNIESKGERWARKVLNTVQLSLEGDTWGGVLVGGCCRTGPDDIEALVHLAKTS